MTRARELARLANENVLSVEDDSLEVGINSTNPTSALDVRGQLNVGTAIKAGTAGVVTATEFSGSIGTFSGAGSFGGNLDVTGNVTIGGTLTYEDVTNIDSVGIVTARAGVNVSGGQLLVGSGVTIGYAGVATFSGNSDIHLVDNIQLKVGDSSDTLLYHDGSHTYLTHPGTGDLRLNANTLQLMSYNSEVYFKGTFNGSSEIYYDNSKKWETTNDGTVTTGIGTFTGGISLNADDKKITVGVGSDLAIYHDGSHSFISNQHGTGNIVMYGNGTNSIVLQPKAGENSIIANSDSSVNLYYNNSEKFQTTNDGTVTTGIGTFTAGVAVDATFGEANTDANDIVIGSSSDTQKGISIVGSTSGGVGNIYFTDGASYKNQGLIQYRHADDSMRFSANQSEALRITSAGSIGINSTSPDRRLTLYQDATTRMNLKSLADSTVGIEFGDPDDHNIGYLVYDNTDNSMQFGINAGERARINQYGMMGLSVTSPDALLSVLAQNSNTPPFVIQNPSHDENFTISTYYDASGMYGTIGANYKLNSGGSAVVDTTDHRTAGIFIDARNHGAIMFETNVAGSQPAERLKITQSGEALLGTSTNRGINGHDPRFQVTGTTYSHATASIINNEANANGAYLFLAKQRSGAVGGSTIVADNDLIGEIRYNAGDGTDIDSYCADIQVKVDGTPGGNDTPGRMLLRVTKDGDNSPTERLRITNKGRIGLSHDTPVARFQIGYDSNDAEAPMVWYGPHGKSGRMWGKYVHNGSGATSNNTNLLSITAFQSTNSHIFGKVNVMGVSPVADFGFEAEGFFYGERGSSNTDITNANFGTMDLVGGTNQTRGTGGNAQGSLSFSGTTLVYATPPVAYVTMRINVEYMIYDGGTVVFDASSGLD